MDQMSLECGEWSVECGVNKAFPFRGRWHGVAEGLAKRQAVTDEVVLH